MEVIYYQIKAKDKSLKKKKELITKILGQVIVYEYLQSLCMALCCLYIRTSISLISLKGLF